MAFSSDTTSTTHVRLHRYFVEKFSKEFRDKHKKEYETTSPYATTTKLPTLRIVDNPIITGKGHTNSISSHSTVYRGFFGGVKGVANSVSGGGGNWNIDTEVQFDKIYLCPVTNREFTDGDMDEYFKNLNMQKRNEVEDKLKVFRYQNTVGSNSWEIFAGGKEYILTQEELEKL